MNKISAEYYDKGFGVTLGVFQVMGIFWVIIFSLIFVFNLFNYNTDNTDYSGYNRSGMSLHTDAKTGLQYLSKSGALIPRLDQDGNHMYINTTDSP